MAEGHEELQELHERAEPGGHGPGMAPVSLTMAVLAVLVAIVTLLGHRAHTEEILLQAKVTDQWAFYQAKNIRRDAYQMFLEQLALGEAQDRQAAERAREKYESAMEKERGRQEEIQAEARKLEGEIGSQRRRADRFDLAEGLLEAALVITSITLLTRRRNFWLFGSVVAAGGLVAAASALLIR